MNDNRIRIVGGEWRSRLISFPAAASLRPTPDRVRETLFNWLGQTLYGKRCLDLFAGSGALGFEALSRGAEKVVMVEADGTVFRALADNKSRLLAPEERHRLDLSPSDALKFVAREDQKYDLVFLDPPFGKGFLQQVLPLLPRLLNPGASVYAEAGEKPDLPTGWEVAKSGKAGKVYYQLLHWKEAE